MHLPFGSEYDSMDSAVRGLVALEQALRVGHDRRAIFLTAYVVVTREVKRNMRQKFFQDNVWVTRYIVRCANLYCKFLADFEYDNLEAVPKSWKISFTTSKGSAGLLMQDLLLGLNAHMNHDLALALDGVTIDQHRAVRYQDYTLLNEAWSAATILLKERLEALYIPGLRLLKKTLRPAAGERIPFSPEKAAANAWESAVALANAHNERERGHALACLEDRSAVLARLLTLPTTEQPETADTLRQLETTIPWWDHISPYRRRRGKTLGVRLR